MKRIIICLFVSITYFSAFAQSADKKMIDLSGYLGIGAFPQGLSSVPVVSGQYRQEGDPYTSIVLGVDFLLKEQFVGFFVESSLKQNFRSNEWIPFWPKEDENEFINTTIVSFRTEANGLNAGVLLGGDVTPNFQVTAKVGAGLSFHKYSFVYESFLEGRQLVEGRESVFNYQLAVQSKYYIDHNFGIVSSLAISKLNPVFTLGFVGRL